MDDIDDEIAGNDKEDIDTDKSGREKLREKMVKNNGKNGYAAQSVDVGTVMPLANDFRCKFCEQGKCVHGIPS